MFHAGITEYWHIICLSVKLKLLFHGILPVMLMNSSIKKDLLSFSSFYITLRSIEDCQLFLFSAITSTYLQHTLPTHRRSTMKMFSLISALAIVASLLPHVVRGAPGVPQSQEEADQATIFQFMNFARSKGSCNCQVITVGQAPSLLQSCGAYT